MRTIAGVIMLTGCARTPVDEGTTNPWAGIADHSSSLFMTVEIDAGGSKVLSDHFDWSAERRAGVDCSDTWLFKAVSATPKVNMSMKLPFPVVEGGGMQLYGRNTDQFAPNFVPIVQTIADVGASVKRAQCGRSPERSEQLSARWVPSRKPCDARAKGRIRVRFAVPGR